MRAGVAYRARALAGNFPQAPSSRSLPNRPHFDMALSAFAIQAARPHAAVFFAGSQEVGVCAGPALALELRPRRRSVTDSTATATPINSSTATNHR